MYLRLTTLPFLRDINCINLDYSLVSGKKNRAITVELKKMVLISLPRLTKKNARNETNGEVNWKRLLFEADPLSVDTSKCWTFDISGTRWLDQVPSFPLFAHVFRYFDYLVRNMISWTKIIMKDIKSIKIYILLYIYNIFWQRKGASSKFFV